ncbi:Y-family DNA polymerase [Saccharospirillum mangrovi]|uniref:Y-family DNA polymerase n=1 Tax=Saccharospirillum mangrovi TaxID=2161747 RepID=UPI000D3D0C59|nr:DNA polymerase Y family protein [Saccharospirillum mangrovi]
MTETTPLWLYLHFPLLALEARFGEAAQTQAAFLTDTDGRSVRQCNAVAQAQGVQPGMTLRTAYCLVETVLQAPYDATLESQQLRRLAVLCYRHCADIRLCPPLGLCLEIGSMLRWHGSPQVLLDALEAALQRSGHRYQLSLGHTPLSARLLAETQRNWRELDRDGERDRLAALPVERLALPLEPRDVQALAAMGLKNLAQLRRAPRSELGYRFGVALINHLNALEQPRVLGERFVLPPRFNERLELWHEVDSAEALIFPIKRLLHALEAYLAACQLSTSELQLELEHREAPPTRVPVRLTSAAVGQDAWQLLVALALERLTLPEAVLAIRLRAEALIEYGGTEGDLLGDTRPQADAQRLLSLLTSKLGATAIQQPSAGADWRPLHASPLLNPGDLPPAAPIFPRAQPALLLPQPKAVERDDYQLLSGPERIALPAWVQADGFQRDYYRAWHLPSRSCHWISRDHQGRWHCEGVFA